jgi:hypothetical protein
MRYLSLLLLLVLGSTALADIPVEPRPRSDKENTATVPVVIKHEAIRGVDASTKAKIVIPRSLLPSEAGGAVGENSRPIGGTVIAGIALSLAAMSLLWLRRGKPGQRTLLVLFVTGALVLGSIGVLFADLAPPGGGPKVRPRPAPAKTTILLEITDEGDDVVLIVAPR